MSRLFLFLVVLIFSSSVLAKDTNNWAYQYRFKLKKDELAKVHVWLSDNGDDDDSGGKNKELFYFRWTLYDGKNIVVHSNYRKFPKQHILSTKRALSTVNQTLISDGKNKNTSRVVLSLIFSDYNHSKKEADFDILIKDDKKRVSVQFDDPKRRRDK